MNDIPVNNWAVGLAIFSFGFLSIGSFLFGATATTAVLRGFGGGMLFGGLLWLVGTLISKEENQMDKMMLEEEGVLGPESTPVKVEPTEPQDK